MALERIFSAYSARMSSASEAMAPMSSAFCLIQERSFSSWPTLPQMAMTSRFFSTCSHLTMTEVSSPPEYARTTFSFSAMVIPFGWLASCLTCIQESPDVAGRLEPRLAIRTGKLEATRDI